jgi:4,5-DOPA dioxygenase extradiol
MGTKHQILFLSHGGGPMPLLGDPGHAEMVVCLQKLASDIPKPSAILVVSAHWEEEQPSITSGASPSLIYDYYGFPEESYSIQYPCKGEPALAKKIHEQLDQVGIESQLDEARGFDHGLFIPLKIMFPEADIPCVQLSLLNNLDPAQHIALGEALQGLEYDNLLVIGSGFSFHNLKAFFAPATAESAALNESFESWLQDTLSDSGISQKERDQRLCDWEKAPGASYCHPREEHLLPLHVCAGLAGRACDELFEVTILNKKSSMYLWR